MFYQFVTPPLFFNTVETEQVQAGSYAGDYEKLESEYNHVHEEKQQYIRSMLASVKANDKPGIDSAVSEILSSKKQESDIRKKATELIAQTNPKADTNDTNYIFLYFVINFFPIGLVGLVLAAIISASMSSTSAELNALASTTVIDIYKRMVKKEASEKHYLLVSKLATIFWGFYAILFALYANRLGSLIEAVNILGSLFYGTILGIFLIAFYLKKIGGNATFFAAIIAEVIVILCFAFTEIPYLWYNVIGCIALIMIAWILNPWVEGTNKSMH